MLFICKMSCPTVRPLASWAEPHNEPATNANTEMHRISWDKPREISHVLMSQVRVQNSHSPFVCSTWTTHRCPVHSSVLFCVEEGGDSATWPFGIWFGAFGTWIDRCRIVAKIRIKFMQFCCTTKRSWNVTTDTLFLAIASFSAKADTDDDDDGDDDELTRMLATLLAIAIAYWWFIRLRFQFSVFAFATWQFALNATQAKKNPPKENKHTLKRTQIKRFAHFWLWFCN